jgi:hypothetical protein
LSFEPIEHFIPASPAPNSKWHFGFEGPRPSLRLRRAPDDLANCASFPQGLKPGFIQVADAALKRRSTARRN